LGRLYSLLITKSTKKGEFVPGIKSFLAGGLRLCDRRSSCCAFVNWFNTAIVARLFNLCVSANIAESASGSAGDFKDDLPKEFDAVLEDVGGDPFIGDRVAEFSEQRQAVDCYASRAEV
jgi:hypothetical protein